MTKYSVLKAKTHLSQLIKAAVMGQEVIIEGRNIPPVKLVVQKPAKKLLGTFEGRVKMHGDFKAPLRDFDEYQ